MKGCVDMDLTVKIHNIKSIQDCEFSLPIDKGIYCLVGSNGCGKSTVLSCVAQTIFSGSLKKLNEYDYEANSYVQLSYGKKIDLWQSRNGSWNTNHKSKYKIHFNGMYEGSLFYGTRFDDSLIIDELVKEGKFSRDDIIDADPYIKEKLSYILHGNYEHYHTLRRVRNKSIAQKARLRNTPYFQEINGNLISQYRMSSGECLLVSLLHFIYNALIRRSLPADQPILMIIDEIELALHPVAVSRLIDLLNNIIKEHDTLTVLLSSHSPEVIHKISPTNMFMMERADNGSIDIFSPCYPSYAIRDVYMHDGFDFVLLVEDILAKYVVETVIRREELTGGRLINILPVGGWRNVLKFQDLAHKTNTFGYGTSIFSIIDGDVKEDANKDQYRKFPKLFLPINSIEKYLYKVCTDSAYKDVKRKINDTFFMVDSMDSILAECNASKKADGKTLYKQLLKKLEKYGMSEEAFIKELSEIIMKFVDFSPFVKILKQHLTRN